jgi:hypothetical protein
MIQGELRLPALPAPGGYVLQYTFKVWALPAETGHAD